MYDSHIHTDFSADSKAPFLEVIRTAIYKNFKIITITDHIDYKHSRDILFEFDPQEYDEAIKSVQKTYSGQIEVLKGLELGLKPSVVKMCEGLMEAESFDFVIASMHSCLGEDFYFGNFFDDKTPEEAMKIYLDEMYQLICAFSDFDVLGHIDLPKRYNEAVNKVDLEDLKPQYEKIFRWLVAHNKGIEVNTSGLRQEVGIQFPDESILRLYFDCGGRIITVGSDAHKASDLGKDFNHVFQVLKSIGFEHICTFKGRQARYHSI